MDKVGVGMDSADKGAFALLALKSASTPAVCKPLVSPSPIISARIRGVINEKQVDFQIPQSKMTIVIGRNSSHSLADISINDSSYISRRHIEIHRSSNKYFLICNGKNGIFINELFQQKDASLFELPEWCTLRFPSTSIRLRFESGLERLLKSSLDVKKADGDIMKPPMKLLGFNDTSFSDTTVPSIPLGSATFTSSFGSKVQRQWEHIVPVSPSGTISAGHSAPASPPLSFSSQGVNGIMLDMKDDFGYNPKDSNVFREDGHPGSEIYDDPAKPPYSYAQLIVQAIVTGEQRQMTLSGIYAYIAKRYPYYRITDKGWQNSIRHNLSLNRHFMKVPRSQEEPGKGSYWRIDPQSEERLIEQAFRKRRQRGVICFTPGTRPKNSLHCPSEEKSYDFTSSDWSFAHPVLDKVVNVSLPSHDPKNHQSSPDVALENQPPVDITHFSLPAIDNIEFSRINNDDSKVLSTGVSKELRSPLSSDDISRSMCFESQNDIDFIECQRNNVLRDSGDDIISTAGALDNFVTNAEIQRSTNSAVCLRGTHSLTQSISSVLSHDGSYTTECSQLHLKHKTVSSFGTVPLLSSVMHSPLLALDNSSKDIQNSQVSQSERELREHVWFSHASNNSGLVFPGLSIDINRLSSSKASTGSTLFQGPSPKRSTPDDICD